MHKVDDMDKTDRVGNMENPALSARSARGAHSVAPVASAPLLRSGRLRVLFLGLLAGAALANHFYFNLYSLWNHTLTDFHVYHEALIHAQGGQPVYNLDSPMPFLYPPFFLILLWPLGWLGEPVAMRVWLTAQSVLLAVALAALLAACGHRPADTTPRAGRAVFDPVLGVWSLALFGFFSPVMLNCLYGQANLLHLALLSVFAAAYLRSFDPDRSERAKRLTDGVAALALSLAISLRVVPAALGVLAALQRRWRIVRWTAALVAVEAVLAGWVVGFAAEWNYFTSYMFHLRRPANMRDISLLALCDQLLGAPASRVVFWAVVAAGIAVFLCAVLRPARRRVPSPALHVAFVLVSMVLFSPLVEYHHYALLLAPFVLTLGYLKHSGGLAADSVLVLVGAWAIVTFSNQMSYYHYGDAGYAALLGAFALWLQIVHLIARGSKG
ncbi:MAG: DUF2029 domain-containing protein [Candidatus Sumerlaeia bacterium]|nr:DUF2029 domain-containing protein [Candidatus Sumerlaeia bacterium]